MSAAAAAPRLLVQMSESDLRAILAEHTDQIMEVVAARPAKVLLDGNGICQLLAVTSPTIRKMRDEGCPFVRVGETYRYDGDSVLEWLRARTEGSR